MAGRTLTVTWQDPAQLAARAREASGLDFLRAIVSGELPPAPIQELLGFNLEGADEGRGACAAPRTASCSPTAPRPA